ncbi:MAG: hypothetical protein WDZ52_08380 [Pseudohongiellaceae bacterium]
MLKFFLAFVLWLSTVHVLATEAKFPEDCAQITTNDAKRLACYDKRAESVRTDAISSTAVSSSTPRTDAGSTEDETKMPTAFAKKNLWSLSRLTSDDPNFFGVSYDPGQKERGVKTHLEFDISLKYPLLESSEQSIRWYLIYNGSYDFQALTDADIYDSKPIISTMQNPGTAFEWDIGNGQRKIRAGFFHHSNGQTLSESRDDTSPETLAKNALALEEFRGIEAKWGEAPALEKLSRSSWYGQLRYQWMSSPDGRIDNDWKQIQLELRPFYVWNDDRIFWPSEPRNTPQIENVDGIRAVGEAMISIPDFIPFVPVRGLARVELQTGLWSPFENVGGEISLSVNVDNLLFSWYYYSGFTKDITNYHKRTQHMGFGFELR